MGFLARALALLVADLSFCTIAFRPISPNKLLRSCFSLADKPMWFQICNVVCVSRHILPITGHTAEDQ